MAAADAVRTSAAGPLTGFVDPVAHGRDGREHEQCFHAILSGMAPAVEAGNFVQNIFPQRRLDLSADKPPKLDIVLAEE